MCSRVCCKTLRSARASTLTTRCRHSLTRCFISQLPALEPILIFTAIQRGASRPHLLSLPLHHHRCRLPCPVPPVHLLAPTRWLYSHALIVNAWSPPAGTHRTWRNAWARIAALRPERRPPPWPPPQRPLMSEKRRNQRLPLSVPFMVRQFRWPLHQQQHFSRRHQL